MPHLSAKKPSIAVASFFEDGLWPVFSGEEMILDCSRFLRERASKRML
jgi:hypothetical protein